jgi:AcrR family transcriptional regulator
VESCGETLRADAQRNREALVRAARAVFGEHGLDAPLDEIARRAGVGNATLYRRFPTRRDLMSAVFEARLAEHVAAVDDALAEDDAWIGFRKYVLAVCALQATDRGLADLVTMSVPEAPHIEKLRVRAYAGVVELVRRAQEAGGLRPDYVPEDLLLLLMANAGLVHRTGGDAPAAWRRFVAFALDGLRADAATTAPPAPRKREIVRVMRSQAEALGCRMPLRSSPPLGADPSTADH